LIRRRIAAQPSDGQGSKASKAAKKKRSIAKASNAEQCCNDGQDLKASKKSSRKGNQRKESSCSTAKQ